MTQHYIYLILNKLNGKTYIGQHTLYNKNWDADGYLGSGVHICRAVKKYGESNFEKFLLQYCNTQEEANAAEVFWIKEYRNRGKAEYNIAAGGNGNPWEYMTEERKKERNKKISEAKKGKPICTKGSHLSEERKKQLSKAHKGQIAWNKGLKLGPLSEETKRKMSEAHKGKHYKQKTVDDKQI